MTAPHRSHCRRCGIIQVIASDMRVLPGSSLKRRPKYVCADEVACQKRVEPQTHIYKRSVR